MALNTPILLITFNRPDHTRKVLERILDANPKDLYIFQDGAREGNENDVIKCAEVRKLVEELCEQHNQISNHKSPITNLHRLYSDVNLGCGPGPMTGIDWFFKNVEQGIVMEDDCLAHPDFFPYCEELLNRYKGTDVKFINATLYHDKWHCDASYGFSHYMVTGAWASYREVWQGFDLDLKALNAWKFRQQVKQITGSRTEANWWYWEVKRIQTDTCKKSYWDFQMQMHLFRQKALTIHPCVNLISNIGFDSEGTHTWTNDGRGGKDIYSILPLNHPTDMVVNNRLDIYCFGKTSPQSWCADLISFTYKYMLNTQGVLHKLLMTYKRSKKRLR